MKKKYYKRFLAWILTIVLLAMEFDISALAADAETKELNEKIVESEVEKEATIESKLEKAELEEKEIISVEQQKKEEDVSDKTEKRSIGNIGIEKEQQEEVKDVAEENKVINEVMNNQQKSFNASETMARSSGLTYGDYTYTVSGEEATITGYTGSVASLTIPEKIGEYIVTGIGNYAFSDCSALETLVLPESIKNLGYYIIKGTKIKKITIPKGVNFVDHYIYEGPLSGCTTLETVIFEDGTKEIQPYMLSSNDYTSYVKKVVIPETVTKIGGLAFYHCINLKEMTFPKKLTEIQGYAFGGCSGLEKIKFIYNEDKVVTESNGIQPYTLKINEYAFADCGLLSEVVLSENVIEIGNGVFLDCKELEVLVLPESIKSLGYYMIRGTKIKEITIPKGVNFVDHYIYEGPLSGCTTLETVIFEDGTKEIQPYMLSSNDYTSYVKKVIIPETVTKIGGLAFYHCINLKEMTFPKKLTEIQGYAFGGCSGLEKIKFIYNEDKVVTESNGIQPYTLKINEYAFVDCGLLSEVVLSENVIEIGNGVFSDCKELEALVLPESIKSLGYYMIRGTKIKKITIPKGVNFVDHYIYEGPLSGCTTLETVIFEDGTKEIQSYMLSSNDYTSYVKKVVIPETVTKIGDESFYKCNNCIIYGYKDSYAETYANENKIPFRIYDSIEGVTKTNEVEKKGYGVLDYKNTKEGNIYDKTVDFNKAMNEYLEALKKSTEQDIKKINNGKDNIAQKLKEADEATNDRIITINSGISIDIVNSVYGTLAQYLEAYTQKGVEIGKIDLSKGTVEISARIINKIRNAMEVEYPFTRKVGKYTVSFYLTKIWDAYTGRIEVSGNGKVMDSVGIINSGSKQTSKIMTEYINEMSDQIKDLLKSSLQSIFWELSNCTGIGEFTKEEIKSLLKDKVELLQKNGYGKMLEYMLKVRDGYEISKDIVAAKDAKSLTDTLKKSEKIYKKLKKIDYSDANVIKEIVNSAMKKLDKIKNNLENALYDYIYDTDSGNENNSLWDNMKKFFVQCPVDFKVYDENGKQIGAIQDGIVSYDSNIFIEISDDVKTIYIPNNLKVSIQYIGTGEGIMNYVIEEIVNGKAVGRLNYYDVPLTTGIEYKQDILGDIISADINIPLKSDDKLIQANEYLSATDENANVEISCNVDEGGTIIGEGKYPKGEPVELSAYSISDEYRFIGWYIDNVLVELNSVYRFTAMNNINLYAKFEKVKEKDTDCKVILSPEYEETAYIHIYKNTDETKEFVISLFGIYEKESLVVGIKKYSKDSHIIENNNVSTIYDGQYCFKLENIDISNFSKAELYDEDGKLLATIYENGNQKLGDVDNSGKVDVNDALVVLKIAASLITPTEEQRKVADVNGDGKVDSGDALLILKYAAGLITEL